MVNTPSASVLAYEIAQLSNQPKVPQVVLLLNDQKKLTRFLDNDSKITIDKGKSKNLYQKQFMASHLPPVYSTGDVATIENLVVSGQHSEVLVSSIKKYVKSLRSTSNLLLLNPPFGTIEYLYRNVWPTLDSRPNLFVGITKAEEDLAVKIEEFKVKMKVPTILMRVSPIPRQLSYYSHESELAALEKLRVHNDLLGLLHATSISAAPVVPISSLFYTYGDLLLIRLEQLIMTSCIEPLAALFECRYKGEILLAENCKDLISKLIKEQIWILKCAHPYLVKIPNASVALDSERLYELTLKEIRNCSRAKSKLFHSLNQLNQTDINQLTGYFVRLAKYKKLDCKWNEVITGLVKGKVSINRNRALNYDNL